MEDTKKENTFTVDPFIQHQIDKVVLEVEKEKEKEMTGRLSAGKLGWPLQWQMLNYFKVPPVAFDSYTLRKFKRGQDVEERIVDWVEPDQSQVWCDYRGVVGYLDMVINDIPVEVKSVTNMAFKHLQRENAPKRAHRLQAELYAHALGYSEYEVAYVASDDYRVLAYRGSVSGEVDEVIDAFDAQVEKGTVPVFEPTEKWTAMQKYSPYPEWFNLSQSEIDKKLKELKVT